MHHSLRRCLAFWRWVMAGQDTLLDTLAERLGGTANVATIFGTAIERDGVTVIPVGRAAYAFGGGSGTRRGEGGSGGGGAVKVVPAGYIEIRADAVRYRPIRNWMVMLPAMLAAATLGAVATSGIVKRRE